MSNTRYTYSRGYGSAAEVAPPSSARPIRPAPAVQSFGIDTDNGIETAVQSTIGFALDEGQLTLTAAKLLQKQPEAGIIIYRAGQAIPLLAFESNRDDAAERLARIDEVAAAVILTAEQSSGE
jgi:hypothetical protein